SLQMLVLRNNNIHRIQPASFFLNMRRFHVLDLSHNKVKSICEEDLLSFQGKHFTLLTLASVTLQDMNEYWLGWDKCGNPFKNMSVMVLDLSGNGLILSKSYNIGSSFGHNNFPDPDKFTFKGLEVSGVKIFDLSQSHIFALSNSVFSLFFFFFRSRANYIYQSFQGLPNLLNLNLTGNALESVHEFATLANLKKLYLGENRISSLLKDLSDLYTILREFSQIEKTFLRGNMFSMCHNQRQIVVSDKLQLLNLELSTMQLIWSEGKCLDVFNNLHQLEQLSLASNGLQSLPKDIFKDLTSLIFLDLSFNSLKHLPNGIFPESLQILKSGLFSTLSYLSLMKNQFHCDCSLRDFQTWLNQTSVTLFHSIEDVTCASPEDQYMVPVVRSGIQCEDE
uniref:Toll-like receptor 5b n=1 Tax=Sinocyclocheilus rhinocerous TaxID=307959 RepID=A0A673IZ56_9TELE